MARAINTFAAAAMVALVILCVSVGTANAACTALSSNNQLLGFSAAVAGCPDVLRCRRQWCSCVGGTPATNEAPPSDNIFGGFNETCLSVPLKTCAAAGACVASYAKCMNNISEYANNATSPDACKSWGAPLHTLLVQIFSEESEYRATTLPATCEAISCPMITLAIGTDDSGISSSCRNVACVSPVGAKLRLSIKGNFPKEIMTNTTVYGQYKKAFESDIQKALGVPCFVTKMILGSLIVTFTTDTSSTNTNLQAALAAAAGNASWLTAITAAYIADGGDPNDIDVGGFTDLTDEDDDTDGGEATEACGVGCKAGVAVGATAGLLIIVAIVYACCCKDKRSNKVEDETKSGKREAWAE